MISVRYRILTLVASVATSDLGAHSACCSVNDAMAGCGEEFRA
jgi:hypothetical protein